MVHNQHATSEVDGLISLAREVLSIHPEPAADAEILVSWAETFFDIAVSITQGSCKTRNLIGS